MAEPKARGIDQLFTDHLRRTSAASWNCPKCSEALKNDEELQQHIRAQHLASSGAVTDEQIDQIVDQLVAQARESRMPAQPRQQATQHQSRPRSPKRPAATTDPTNYLDQADQSEQPQQKRVKSPSPTQQPSSPSSTKPQRSRAARPHPTSTDFTPASRDTAPGKTLWSEGQPGLTRPPQQQRGHQGGPPAGRPAHVSNQSYRRGPQAKGGGGAGIVNVRGGGSSSGHAPSDQDAPEAPNVNFMIPQPETRPISQEQLVAEVKGIYAGLVMVESKCIEVDNAQNSQNDTSPPLNKEQWQALIALHRTLLHEHHDFFLASQHPSASEALRRLANKYAMPARMWRHGIHSFLELLRHRLPDALEYMQTFIYLAYSMMALLYETVPAFEETWIECLGDLSRYRMAIEDDDLHDREVWTSVSRHWYSKASDKTPATGRLHHHLAILARPNAVMQLFYYVKSLSVATPFNSARESILTLFDPILNGNPQIKLDPVDSAFVKVHGVFFTSKHVDQLEPARAEIFKNLDLSIARATNWAEIGYHFGITNSCACFEYGAPSNVLVKTLAPSSSAASVSAPSTRDDASTDTPMANTGEPKTEQQPQQQQQQPEPVEPSPRFLEILAFAHGVDRIVIGRLGDPNVMSYLHVRAAFMRAMVEEEAAIPALEATFPWALFALACNALIASFDKPERFQTEGAMPGSTGSLTQLPKRPLPEDWGLRGLTWADVYFSPQHFEAPGMDMDERTFEIPSMVEQRHERILWHAFNIARRGRGRWLSFDAATTRFKAADRFAAELPPAPAAESWSVARQQQEAAAAAAAAAEVAAAAATSAQHADAELLPDAEEELPESSDAAEFQ